MNFWNFLINDHAEILSRTWEHLLLVGAAMLAAVLVGIPLGIALVRRQKLRRWVLGAANVIQTIPSLALFGFLIPVPFLGGIGARTAIVALALYALLPILTNTYTGIAGVDIYQMDADGKAVEHWDTLQAVGTRENSAPIIAPNIPRANPNGMF